MLDRTVTEAARRFGDRTCLVAPTGWVLSYRDLDRAADEVAVGLAAAGLGPGGVLGVVLGPCPEYVVLYAAAARLGAATAGVNPRLTAPERATVLDAAGPDLVVGDPRLLPPDAAVAAVAVEPVRRDGGGDGPDVLAGLRRPGTTPPRLPEDPDRPVAIVFTSGTTGVPKGAVFAGRQLDFICGVDTGHRWADPGGPVPHALAGTSLTHLGPTTKLPGNLHRGVTTHVVDRWRADDALRMVARYRMPGIGGIPTQVALMLRSPELDHLDLACVTAVVMGGGPTTPALVRAARERLHAAVAVRYACTEAGVGVGTALDDPPEDAEESVGRAHAGVELTIRDPDGRPVAPGEVGEVCLRSPAVMSGFHRDAAATAGAFWDDGAVRTGDLGRLDDRGRLHLAGRSKEMFVRGGYNVYPMEVEAVLSTHPGVADVVVVPRPDDVMGEVGVAVVVPRDPAAAPSLLDLRSHATGRLAAHKLPEELRLVEHLPLTSMDKVDRRAVRSAVDGRT